MATTVAELIRQAYILAQVWDPGEEQTGAQASEGLLVLNNLINHWSSMGTYIPAYKTLTLSLSENEYLNTLSIVITDILNAHIVDAANCNSILQEANLQTFNTFNFNNVNGRPRQFYVESNESFIQTKTNLYTYPPADGDYTATFYIKQTITEFNYSDTITTLPLYYIKPLIYQLGKELSIINLTTLSPAFEQEYQTVIADLKAANRKDLSVQAPNPFQNGQRRFRPWNVYGY